MNLAPTITGIALAATIGAGSIVYEPPDAEQPPLPAATEPDGTTPLPGCAFAWPADAKGWDE